MENPAAAGYFSGTLEYLSATSPHSLRRRINVVYSEVVNPGWDRHRLKLSGNATDRVLSSGEQLIGTRRAHRGLPSLPPKQRAVKNQGRRRIGGKQFVPTYTAWRVPLNLRTLGRISTT